MADTNVALGKPASQSSLSEWSSKLGAAGANNGAISHYYGIHTTKEPNPWWLVDLEYVYPIDRIVIHNRLDGRLERAKTIVVEISQDRESWLVVHEGIAHFSGGTKGPPLTLPLRRKEAARYVRVSLAATEYLHLTQVEVFASADAPLAGSISRFESMGGGSNKRGGWAYGCEFALFQRKYGHEQLGLLRWASITMQDLITAVEDHFIDLENPDTLDVTEKFGWDWGIIQQTYQLRIDHSNLSVERIPKQDAARQLLANLRFLRRKFLEDLAEGDKIFVYRVIFLRAPMEAIMRLAEVMEKHGPAVLFFVQRADQTHPAFTFERPRKNLLIGYIDRFAATSAPVTSNDDGWARLCMEALRQLG